MINDTITVKTYKSLTKCLKTFFNGTIPESGWWEWLDADGCKHKIKLQDAIKRHKKEGCWGWVENKDTIHLWVGKKCSSENLIRLIAHELGHMNRPFHRSLIEEQKAERYAAVAQLSLIIMGDVNVPSCKTIVYEKD